MKEWGVGVPTFNNRLTVLSSLYATACPRPDTKRFMKLKTQPNKPPVVLSVYRRYQTSSWQH